MNHKIEVKCSLFPGFNIFTFTEKKIQFPIAH